MTGRGQPFVQRARILEASWTPGRKDIASIMSHWQEFSDIERRELTSKFCRLDAPAANEALKLLRVTDLKTHCELIRPIFKSAIKSAAAKSELLRADKVSEICRESLCHPEARVRKSTAQVIGSSWTLLDAQTASELIDLMTEKLPSVLDSSEMKAFVDALGKSGSERAFKALNSCAVTSAKIMTDRAMVKLKRDMFRLEQSQEGTCFPELISSDRDIIVWFRPGLEDLALNLPIFKNAKRVESGVLLIRQSGWTAIKEDYLWKRAGFVISEKPLGATEDLARVLKQMSHEIVAATSVNAQFPVRVRVGRSEKVSRSFLWEFAARLNEADCRLINDGRDPHWEIVGVGGKVVLVPRKFIDSRFEWRNSLLEGASDPTIASALVCFAEIGPNDVVYDPFCGAGTELVLSKKIANAKTLIGSDRDEKAVASARDVLKKAEMSADLFCADAISFDLKACDVVISNPPFGMRTSRGAARDILEQFFSVVSRKLSPRGRIIILSHAPSSTRQWAHDAGFVLTKHMMVRLGNMPCEIQRFERG